MTGVQTCALPISVIGFGSLFSSRVPGLRHAGILVGGGIAACLLATILVLPALFAAGMSLIDATDGVLMLGAYGWAYIKPIRKLYYNLNITFVSVLIAFAIGGIEVMSILAERFGLRGGIWSFARNLDFGIIGFGIVGIFVASWTASTLIYRWKRYDSLPVTTVHGTDA